MGDEVVCGIVSGCGGGNQSAQVSNNQPTFGVRRSRALPIVIFLFFSRFLQINMSVRSTAIFLNVRPFPLFRRSGHGAHQSSHGRRSRSNRRARRTMNSSGSSSNSTNGTHHPMSMTSLGARRLREPLRTLRRQMIKVTFILTFRHTKKLYTSARRRQGYLYNDSWRGAYTGSRRGLFLRILFLIIRNSMRQSDTCSDRCANGNMARFSRSKSMLNSFLHRNHRYNHANKMVTYKILNRSNHHTARRRRYRRLCLFDEGRSFRLSFYFLGRSCLF